jgi:hypothetical protein
MLCCFLANDLFGVFLDCFITSLRYVSYQYTTTCYGDNNFLLPQDKPDEKFMCYCHTGEPRSTLCIFAISKYDHILQQTPPDSPSVFKSEIAVSRF